MITYLSAFIFYTLAMVGILLIGFVIYKKITPMGKNENKGMIKILDSLPIGNKKVLLVVKIKNEKFLIASGLEHTTFLSKLNDENQTNKKQTQKNMEIKNVEMKTNDFQSLINAQNDMAQIFKQVQHEEKPKIKPQQDELQQARLQKLQRQFDELYNKDEEENIKTMVNEIKKTDRQKLIKRLLKELNTDTNQNAYKAEGRF